MSRTVPPKPVGIVLTGFRAGDLIQTALDSTTKDVAVNVYDMNATDATSSFMYSTNQWESKTGYYTDIPASQAQGYINAAPFTTTTTVTVADRTFKLVFMPTAALISANETTTKIFVLTAALVVLVVLLLGCLALFFIGRLYRKKRSFTRMLRRMDTERLSLLESNKLKLEQLLNQIAQQEYKTRLINNSIPDQIIVITDEGKIAQTNTSFDKAFNFTEIEFEKGVDIYSIFPELEKNFFANQRGAIQTTARTRFGTNLNMTIIAKSLKKEGTLYNDGELEAFVIIAKAVGVSEREEAVVQEKVIPMMKQFEHDWRHESSRKRLVEFAKKEMNEENLHFLERVTMYKKLPLEHRVDMQRQIYEKFVLNGGELQLNVDVELAKTLAIKMGKSLGDLSLFDEVEDFVKRMVVQDIYPRFVTEEKNRSIQSSSESSLTA
jgi:PAS domain-containing protein